MSDTPDWAKDMEDPKFLHRTMYGGKKRVIRVSGDKTDEDQSSYVHRNMGPPRSRPENKGTEE